MATALNPPHSHYLPESEVPAIHVHFTDGPGETVGTVESAAAAIAPAVANAIFNATGRRIRMLPIVAIPMEVS